MYPDQSSDGVAGEHVLWGPAPNGLAAAVVRAQAGLAVDVFEAELTPGGAVRSMELTQPGFLHDFGSAVHPLGVGSPFFSSLPLPDHGLEWVHSPAPLAHPLDDGTAVMLERDLDDARVALEMDGNVWCKFMRPFVEQWSEFASDVLHPMPSMPKHPGLMARFGMSALHSAKAIAHRFRSERTRALFAGLAAHSVLRLDQTLSCAFGLLMGVLAHAVGWPIPRGGSQSLTNALCGYLAALGGSIKTGCRVDSLAALSEYDLILCDVTPRQLLNLGTEQLSESYKRDLRHFRYGPGVFKADYALSQPVPWKAADCLRAATVHLGGTFDEIALSEEIVQNGQHAARPFVLLTQPTLFDASRAPKDKHIAWAYCHVPNGSKVDMLQRLEDQIERSAPGFRETVLARRTFSPEDLERMDANLVGGDTGGGAVNLLQFLFRATWKHYSTSAKNIYLGSASTPPGGGVRGMCGYHAAKIALRAMR